MGSSPPIQQQLGLLLLAGQQWVTTGLVRLMAKRGHEDLTAAHLMFLSNLDCGDTYASEVARRLGVSRQAVYRSTRELQRIGVLTLETDEVRRTQKLIRMSGRGQQIAIDARLCLEEIEAALSECIGRNDLSKLAAILGKNWGPPLGAQSNSKDCGVEDRPLGGTDKFLR